MQVIAVTFHSSTSRRKTERETLSTAHQAVKQPHLPAAMADTAEDVQEPGIDPQMNDLAGWLWRGIYYTFRSIGLVIYYIVYCVSFAVLFLLRLLWRPLEFILLPVFYLLQFIFNLLLAPFQFLAKFEVCSFSSW